MMAEIRTSRAAADVQTFSVVDWRTIVMMWWLLVHESRSGLVFTLSLNRIRNGIKLDFADSA
jgi:hypothetical protein